MRLPIRVLLPVALVVVPAVSSISGLWYARALGFHQGFATAQHALRDVLADAQLTVGRALADKKMELVHESFAELALHPGVRWSALLDPTESIVAATRIAWRDQRFGDVAAAPVASTVAQLGAQVRHSEVPEVSTPAGMNHLVGITAVRGSSTQALVPGPLWLLVVAYDYEAEVQSHLLSATIVAGAVGVSAMTFGLLLAVYLQRAWSGRLKSILRATAAVAAGDLSVRSGVDGGDELGQIGADFDAMTSRLAADTAARMIAEKKFRDAFEHDGDALLLLSSDQRVIEANIAAERLLGRDSDTLRSLHLHELGLDSGRGEVGAGAATTASVLTHGGDHVDVELRRYGLSDGATLIRLRDLRPERELDLLRERLRTADRLAALGALSASVGHEINNPLSFVIGNLQALRDTIAHHGGSAQLVAETDEIVADIGEGAERIRRIVQELRHFSRTKDDGAHQTFEPASAVRSALALASPAVRACAAVTESITQVPAVLGDPRKLGQVVINLVVNAGEAIAGQGRRDGRIEVRLHHQAGSERPVVLEVADDGPGIDADVRARLFEPFFTTKSAGQGTGLGLTISREIVTKMGGELTVESAPGGGAMFRVTLPAAPTEGAAAP